MILADQTSLSCVTAAAVRGMLLMERKLLSNSEEKGIWQDNRTMKFRNDGAGETEQKLKKKKNFGLYHQKSVKEKKLLSTHQEWCPGSRVCQHGEEMLMQSC